MHLSWFDLSVYAGKTAVVMIVLVFLYRVLGKRELGQMNVYDLATIVAVANAVQNAMTQGRGELLVGIVTSGTLVVVAYLASRLLVRLPGGERVVIGQPVLILSDGKPLYERMKRERITRDDLRAAIRQHGLYSPSQVALAVLEVDGSISIVPHDETHHVETDFL